MSRNDNTPFDPTLPLIGQRPKLRVEHVPVANLVMSDADGDAELRPQDDITLIELYKVFLLMAWILGNPPVPQPDPRTGGKTPLLRALQWRQFVADEQLERHFDFRLRADQQTKGSA